MVGKLLWFNTFKGYGEIESENGDRFFFTKDELAKNFPLEKLENSINLSFTKSTHLLFGSYRAKDVVILKANLKKSNRTQVKEVRE